VLLLVIVLAMPAHAALLDFRNRRPLASNRASFHVQPRSAASCARARAGRTLSLRGIALSFGNVRAIDGLDLDVKPGADPRPDRPGLAASSPKSRSGSWSCAAIGPIRPWIARA